MIIIVIIIVIDNNNNQRTQQIQVSSISQSQKVIHQKTKNKYAMNLIVAIGGDDK